MKFVNVENDKARQFLEVYRLNRSINREFYQRVKEEDFDFRMVDRPQRRSDSVRESLAHQIAVEQTYLEAVESGKLSFGEYGDSKLKSLSKSELLNELAQADEKLVELMSDEEKIKRKVEVSWSEELIDVVDMLWSLNSHEVLHTGWNMAVMDHLQIERFNKLKEMWG